MEFLNRFFQQPVAPPAVLLDEWEHMREFLKENVPVPEFIWEFVHWLMLQYAILLPFWLEFYHLHIEPVIDKLHSAPFLKPLLKRFEKEGHLIHQALKHSDFPIYFLYAFIIFAFAKLLLKISNFFFGPSELSFKQKVFGIMRKLPFFRYLIDKELKKVLEKVEEDLIGKDAEDSSTFDSLPKAGLSSSHLVSLLSQRTHRDLPWQDGKVSGAVYSGDTALSHVIHQALVLYSHHNPLHPDLFPSTRKMEAEIVSCCLKLFGNPKQGCGNLTSGGTESILLACKTYREWAKQEKGISSDWEILAPVTVHAAFDKAASYFGMKLRHVPLNKNWQVDLKKMERMITSKTVMLVGSAPNFPHGIVDDIQGLAKLAQKYQLGLHVDCCLGSFVVAHMKKAGYSLPPFDFSVRGVTSISCDTHKFGFAPKGSSVVMYVSPEWRKFQYFVCQDWTGGIYASPSIAGSRPGALIAGCWTAMMYMGENGYIESTKKIIEAAKRIKEGISQIEHLQVCGDPQLMVVAFQSPDLNVYSIADEMSKRGWNLNALQNPASVHLCVTLPVSQNTQLFLSDLSVSVEKVLQRKKANNGEKDEGVAAIYGMAASLPDKRLIGEVTVGYLDALTKLKQNKKE